MEQVNTGLIAEHTERDTLSINDSQNKVRVHNIELDCIRTEATAFALAKRVQNGQNETKNWGLSISQFVC